jgi:Fe-S cluster biosynthesis and repair protein YggX
MATRKHEAIEELDEDRVEYLTREEALAMFDETARRCLNMSGEEFLRRWKADDFEGFDDFEVTHVGILAPLFLEE